MNVDNAYASAVSAVNNAINALNSAASTNVTMNISAANIPTAPDYSSASSSLPSITEATLVGSTGTVPSVAALGGTEYTNATLNDVTALAITHILSIPEFSTTDLTDITVDFSAVPDIADFATFNSPKWAETNWTNLKTVMNTFVSNVINASNVDELATQLTNDSTKMQVAFYAMDRERKQQGLRDAFSAANSATGARGFTYPNSMTTALKLAAQQQYQFDLSQTSRDLIKYIYEWAKTNYQFTIDKGIAVHNSDIEWNARYADVLLKSFTAQLDNIFQQMKLKLEYEIQKIDANVKQYQISTDTIIRKYIASTDVEMKTYIENHDLELKRFTAESDNNIRGYTAQRDAQVKSYTAESDAKIRTFSASTDSVIKAAEVNASIKRQYYSSLIEKAKLLVEEMSEADKNALTQYSSAVQEHTAIVNAQVRIISDNAVMRVNAASAAVQGAAALANSISQSEISLATAV